MQDTQAVVGTYAIKVAFEDAKVDEEQRVKVLTNWLVDAFSHERKEVKDVEPRSAG